VFRTKVRTLGSGRWGQSASYTFLGFIYNPAVDFEICPYTTPTTAFKKGATGDNVRWLQWHLNHEGYNLKIDGSWGNDTQTAFNAWQMQTGLDIDGWCGALSRERLVALLPWNKGV
jgi:N-acetyl-anhydromuramyl-L-alanine amidase AmpD